MNEFCLSKLRAQNQATIFDQKYFIHESTNVTNLSSSPSKMFHYKKHEEKVTPFVRQTEKWAHG